MTAAPPELGWPCGFPAPDAVQVGKSLLSFANGRTQRRGLSGRQPPRSRTAAPQRAAPPRFASGGVGAGRTASGFGRPRLRALVGTGSRSRLKPWQRGEFFVAMPSPEAPERGLLRPDVRTRRVRVSARRGPQPRSCPRVGASGRCSQRFLMKRRYAADRAPEADLAGRLRPLRIRLVHGHELRLPQGGLRPRLHPGRGQRRLLVNASVRAGGVAGDEPRRRRREIGVGRRKGAERERTAAPCRPLTAPTATTRDRSLPTESRSSARCIP